jgi:hypothetical protein
LLAHFAISAVTPWRIIGFVWGYNLVWMIVQDVTKLGLYEAGSSSLIGRGRFSGLLEFQRLAGQRLFGKSRGEQSCPTI